MPLAVGLGAAMIVLLLLSRNDSPLCKICAGKAPPNANAEKPT
jgi:hypothetical protein